jgi:hypothetical protein
MTSRECPLPPKLSEDIPADTWSDLDTAAEAEKAHGRSEWCITPQDVINGAG